MSGTTRTLSSLALLGAPSVAFLAGPATASNGWTGVPPSAAKPHSGVPQPRTKFDPIPYGKDRKRQMANYSNRHYGKRTWRLEDPDVIVLHYTATSTYSPVFNTFASNAPSLGERPGVCSQFVVEKDGTIHQQQ